MPGTFENRPDITESLLVKLAGIRAYERGADYFDEGRVGELFIQDDTISAEVDGTESYQVSLIYTQRGLSGACDCPASEGIDFCKHCVATALALKAQYRKMPLKKGADQKTVLTTWLEQQSKAEIIQHFVAVVTKDRNLRREWLLKAEKGLGRVDKSSLKKQITSALPLGKHLYEYPKVRAYFANTTMVMRELEESIGQLPTSERLELIGYAFQRLEQALDTIDDSGGFRYDTLNILNDAHRQMLKDAEWSDEESATYLLDLILDDGNMFYGEFPYDYTDCITPLCLEHFYSKAQKQWDALPPLTSDKWEAKRPYSRLESLLSTHVKEKNDKLALIAIKEKVAVSSHDYLRIAEIYFELGNYDQTQVWLDKAQSSDKFGHRKGRDLQLKLWQKTGRGQKATQEQWCYLQKTCLFDSYQKLLELAEQENDGTDWTTKTIGFLREQLDKYSTDAERVENMYKSPEFRNVSTTANTLAMIYLKQQDLDNAWQVVQSWRITNDNLLVLANALADDATDKNWARGVHLYRFVIDGVVSQTQNSAYQQAIRLLKDLAGKASTPDQREDLNKMVVALRSAYKPKRNFISLLAEAFP